MENDTGSVSPPTVADDINEVPLDLLLQKDPQDWTRAMTVRVCEMLREQRTKWKEKEVQKRAKGGSSSRAKLSPEQKAANKAAAKQLTLEDLGEIKL